MLQNQYWVPRIQLMFRAEDARVFARRVADAYRLRKNTEGLIRYLKILIAHTKNMIAKCLSFFC